MNFIALPSGRIINLNLVASIYGSGLDGSQIGKLDVLFSAMAFGAGVGGALKIELKGDDITAFLNALGKLGLPTAPTLASVTRKLK